MGRDPFPFPKLQNDNNFVGRSSKPKSPYKENTSDAQKRDPWNRLNRTPTLASFRREVYHFDPQAPNDCLDFVIKSKYDQHTEFLRGNNKTLVQKETVGDEHGRILKNRKKEVPLPFDPLYPPLRSHESLKKEDPNNSEGAIQSHHSAATNGGYSRRHDGGFYMI